MGSRGAFVNVNSGDFTFVDNGQHYYSIGTLSSNSNVKVLLQKDGAVKAPEYSHTGERIYAIVQDGALKHLTFYDENHMQAKSIDLLHEHGPEKIKPHIHYYLDHTDKGIPVTDDSDKVLIQKIKKEFHLR